MGRLSLGQWFEVGIWLTVAAVAYAFSFEFDRDIEMYRFGASGWPRLIILLIALGTLGQFLQDLLKAKETPVYESGYFSRFSGHGPEFVLRMGLTLGLPLVYAALLQGMGFYALTPFFLASYLYLTGVRRVAPLILVPLVLYGAVTLLFTRVLYVGLPTGYWPGFYDFGNWVVVLLRG